MTSVNQTTAISGHVVSGPVEVEPSVHVKHQGGDHHFVFFAVGQSLNGGVDVDPDGVLHRTAWEVDHIVFSRLGRVGGKAIGHFTSRTVAKGFLIKDGGRAGGDRITPKRRLIHFQGFGGWIQIGFGEEPVAVVRGGVADIGLPGDGGLIKEVDFVEFRQTGDGVAESGSAKGAVQGEDLIGVTVEVSGQAMTTEDGSFAKGVVLDIINQLSKDQVKGGFGIHPGFVIRFLFVNDGFADLFQRGGVHDKGDANNGQKRQHG